MTTDKAERLEARLQGFVDELVEEGTVSAAVALVAEVTPPSEYGARARVEGAPVVAAAGERARGGEAVGVDTRFDYGSLTKPFTATLALVLDAAGELPLGTRVAEVVDGAHPDLARARVSELLSHRSGLRAWTPLYAAASEEEGPEAGREASDPRRRLLSGDLMGAPLPTYSDLGYIVYGLLAETAAGRPLADLVAERVVEPLGLDGVEPSPGDRPDLAHCSLDGRKEAELAADLGIEAPPVETAPPGVVQDGNARYLLERGVRLAGHAGLFGTARALGRLGAEWLTPGKLLAPPAVAAALAPRPAEKAGDAAPWRLGWVGPMPRGSTDEALSRDAFGHVGFPGGSLWCDPAEERVYVLLAHRRHATDEFQRHRQRFHRLAAEACGRAR